MIRVILRLSKTDRWTLLSGAGVRALATFLRTASNREIKDSDKALCGRIGTFCSEVSQQQSKGNQIVHGLYGRWPQRAGGQCVRYNLQKSARGKIDKEEQRNELIEYLGKLDALHATARTLITD